MATQILQQQASNVVKSLLTQKRPELQGRSLAVRVEKIQNGFLVSAGSPEGDVIKRAYFETLEQAIEHLGAVTRKAFP